MARYTTADPYAGERERQYLSDRALDSQMAVYSPDAPFNSISTIAPYSTYGNPHTSSGALVRGGLVEEPLVEHEHHHVHHHIDHGNLAVGPVAVRPRIGREYSYDDLYDRERRYGSGASLGSFGHYHNLHGPRHGHRYRGFVGGRYARSDIDLLDTYRHRRGSIYDDRDSELAIIDVPAGTRRVTVDMGRDIDINWRRDNGVRRSRGLGSELWTEITKDLVTREAIEDCGYPYEETEYFYYIFEYLHRDQINELVDISYEIRRQRVRDLEYDSIAGIGHRLDRRLDYEHDETRTEIIIENGRRGGRHRNRYYH
ncbi:hypothetical protein C7212DRAFT_341555 [Tuber magnatum]|uniref:DUF8035 domain-containing protein n=1 Tax=Tuber magnatum TaxID=42249 RepID=A0A317SZS1_9PEZI|nr:hypothetical protein C7212DRAFT_341555 [Tuber magnatum]